MLPLSIRATNFRTSALLDFAALLINALDGVAAMRAFCLIEYRHQASLRAERTNLCEMHELREARKTENH
jgi:hypothetical protein